MFKTLPHASRLEDKVGSRKIKLPVSLTQRLRGGGGRVTKEGFVGEIRGDGRAGVTDLATEPQKKLKGFQNPRPHPQIAPAPAQSRGRGDSRRQPQRSTSFKTSSCRFGLASVLGSLNVEDASSGHGALCSPGLWPLAPCASHTLTAAAGLNGRCLARASSLASSTPRCPDTGQETRRAPRGVSRARPVPATTRTRAYTQRNVKPSQRGRFSPPAYVLRPQICGSCRRLPWGRPWESGRGTLDTAASWAKHGT